MWSSDWELKLNIDGGNQMQTNLKTMQYKNKWMYVSRKYLLITEL